jgi:hypothetical protein
LGGSTAVDPEAFEREFGTTKLSDLIKMFQAGVEEDLEVCEMQNQSVREEDENLLQALGLAQAYHGSVNELTVAWGDIEGGLRYVEGKQAAMDMALSELEKATVTKLDRGDVVLAEADRERIALYDLVEGMDEELNGLLRRVSVTAGSLQEIYEQHVVPANKANAMALFLRLANDHQQALEWLQRTGRRVEEGVGIVEGMLR